MTEAGPIAVRPARPGGSTRAVRSAPEAPPTRDRGAGPGRGYPATT